MFSDAKGHTVAEALTFALQTERDASFPTVGRLLSTEAKRFIRYASQLPDDRWQILSRTLAKRGSRLLVKSDEKFAYVQIEAAFTDAERQELGAWHRAALSAGGDVNLMPLRLMKMAVGVDKSAMMALIQGFLKQDIMEDMKWWTPISGSPQGALNNHLLKYSRVRSSRCSVGDPKPRSLRN